MTLHDHGSDAGGDRFDEIEAILQRYPDIEDSELKDLRRWFDREASSFEVASMAGKANVAPQYAAFKQAYIDKFGLMEKALGLVIAIMLLAGLGYAFLAN